MSFAASLDGGRIEYAGDSLNALYAQRRNLASPRFQAMVWDILRFNRLGKQLLAGSGDGHLTLGEWLARERFGDAFRFSRGRPSIGGPGRRGVRGRSALGRRRRGIPRGPPVVGDAGVILTGAVMHRRLFPVRYRFVYRLFSLLLDLDELPRLHRRLRLFSHNRFNLFGFYDRDHGSGEDVPLRRWIEEVLARHGIELDGGRIELLSFPCVLGHVFNPISIWYCRHRSGSLRAVVCDVNNTFGERHHYLLHEQGKLLEWPLCAEKAKVYHVSPFVGMQARHRFRLSGRDDRGWRCSYASMRDPI
jgi:hypothetical protein